MGQIWSHGDDASRDLMSQAEGERVSGAHSIIEEAQVGVADTTAGDLHKDLSIWGYFG